jgi:hypothetical protein
MSLDRIRQSGADADAGVAESGAGQDARSDETAGAEAAATGGVAPELDGLARGEPEPEDTPVAGTGPVAEPAGADLPDVPGPRDDVAPDVDPDAPDEHDMLRSAAEPGPEAEPADAPDADQADRPTGMAPGADAPDSDPPDRPTGTAPGADAPDSDPPQLPTGTAPDADRAGADRPDVPDPPTAESSDALAPGRAGEDASASSGPAPQGAASRVPTVSGPDARVAVPVEPGPPTMSNTDARLAHVHVATGMYGLGRAELETLAARGALDVPALADLAEVRWRTGDLVGAGEAADAHLQAGGDELIAICVAAEAASAAGRSADARNLAARVLARGRDRLDDLFAGQPRGAIWPPAAVSERSSVAPPSVGSGAPQPAPSAAAPSMSGALAEVQVRLGNGEFAGAATRLALLLRTHPVLAPAILSVADQALQAGPPAQEVAALHLVRGDAYRLMGRESLAAEAFQQSTRALRARSSEEKP